MSTYTRWTITRFLATLIAASLVLGTMTLVEHYVNVLFIPPPPPVRVTRLLAHKVAQEDKLTNKFLNHWYLAINDEYFDGKLPISQVIYDAPPLEDEEVIGATLDNYESPVRIITIYINPKYNLTVSQALMTEYHEMCHVAHPLDYNHGDKFQTCMKRLAAQDAFKELW